MDTLRDITDKLERLKGTIVEDPLRAVTTHLEMAEEHFRRGRSDNNDNLFTDVVYRTNHAYEGILKEALRLFTGEDASRLSPHEIEQYLEHSNRLHSRVTGLLTHYRQQWRNPSTHEYKLFFNEQEAYLCILSVSSFVSILIDQMVEQVAFEREQANAPKQAPTTSQDGPSTELLTKLLLRFAETQPPTGTAGRRHPAETEGALRGFLAATLPTAEVASEASMIVEGRDVGFDLLVRGPQADSLTAIELKAPSNRRLIVNAVDAATTQLLAAMKISKIGKGIVLVLSPEGPSPYEVDSQQLDAEGLTRRVVRIYPKLQAPTPTKDASTEPRKGNESPSSTT